MKEWEFHLLEDRLPIEEVPVKGGAVRTGDRVRLRPGGRGDAQDLMLADQTAVVESIEQDYEDRVHVSVVLEDDPGRDIGFSKQPGHRFFFAPEELERLEGPGRGGRRTVLVACIGNVFQADDAFGVEVARHMEGRPLPDGVRVVDFGIRSFDLAYALTSGYDLTILVDACARGEAPGTLYVIDPELPEPGRQQAAVQTHGMTPDQVLHLAVGLGGELGEVRVVGCEPADLGPEEGLMGLSDAVRESLDRAVELIEQVVGDFLEEPRSPAERGKRLKGEK